MKARTHLAVIICDMWADEPRCVSARARADDIARRMNPVVSRLRARGALIIHAPAGCLDFYRDASARRNAIDAPHHHAPVPFDWNDWNGDRESELPPALTESGLCSCDTVAPCRPADEVPRPGTRQTPLVEIHDHDALTDDGQEVYNLLEERGIDDVIVMGVHTNRCILGRPYGIRQLVYLGKRPVLCRDLTDSFHRDPRGHAWGDEYMAVHIARHWCPVTTSADLLGD